MPSELVFYTLNRNSTTSPSAGPFVPVDRQPCALREIDRSEPTPTPLSVLCRRSGGRCVAALTKDQICARRPTGESEYEKDSGNDAGRLTLVRAIRYFVVRHVETRQLLLLRLTRRCLKPELHHVAVDGRPNQLDGRMVT
jgi:hypothetical protein